VRIVALHRVQHLAVTERDPGVTFHACDAAPEHVKFLRRLDCFPFRRSELVRVREAFGIDWVFVLLGKRWQRDAKPIAVNEPHHSPTVESIAVSPVQLVRDADIIIRPRHQNRPGVLLGVYSCAG